MLNIPFLRRLAVWLHVIGWCNIIIVPPATMVSMVRTREIIASVKHGASGVVVPPLPPSFPWDDFAVAVLKSVALGVAVLVLAQLVGLGIRALEHLRNLDGAEVGSAEPTEEPLPAGIGRRILALPGRFPSLRLLSRVATARGGMVSPEVRGGYQALHHLLH